MNFKVLYKSFLVTILILIILSISFTFMEFLIDLLPKILVLPILGIGFFGGIWYLVYKSLEE